jgi:carbon storage regulator
MLVLARRRDETIRIGDDISVKVVRIGPNSVRLGIQAPQGVAIHRQEIWEAIQACDPQPYTPQPQPAEACCDGGDE